MMGVARCASLDDQEQAQCEAYQQVFIAACSFHAHLASLNILWVHHIYCQRGQYCQNIQQDEHQSRFLLTWLHI
jgi:hypothetical protein